MQAVTNNGVVNGHNQADTVISVEKSQTSAVCYIYQFHSFKLGGKKQSQLSVAIVVVVASSLLLVKITIISKQQILKQPYKEHDGRRGSWLTYMYKNQTKQKTDINSETHTHTHTHTHTPLS